MRSFRDPLHGFIHADELETALINSAPVQRLRFVHQLGFAFLVFPGAEHSRFSHVLGTMHLAGKVYDVLASRHPDLLQAGPTARDRRLLRAAALLHDIGHAPFSHSAEDLFAEPIDHEEMTRRLLAHTDIQDAFASHGDGITTEDVAGILSGSEDPHQQLLSRIVAGELDVDKMDYLLRDSLYCGVRYGSYDLDRLLETVEAIEDPESGGWGIGVEEGGVHALEALVMARYYMFTQVYFNVVGKALELHFHRWLSADKGRRWPTTPEEFLSHDDVSTMQLMRDGSDPHAEAIIERRHFPLVWQSDEHMARNTATEVREWAKSLEKEFSPDSVLVSHASKDPHRLQEQPIWVRQRDGKLLSMRQASHFIHHLERIDRIRVYAAPACREDVAARVRDHAGLSAVGSI